MKRKYVESRLTEDKETKANGFKGFSSVQQSTNFTSPGQEESSEDDQKESAKETSDQGCGKVFGAWEPIICAWKYA